MPILVKNHHIRLHQFSGDANELDILSYWLRRWLQLSLRKGNRRKKETEYEREARILHWSTPVRIFAVCNRLALGLGAIYLST